MFIMHGELVVFFLLVTDALKPTEIQAW